MIYTTVTLEMRNFSVSHENNSKHIYCCPSTTRSMMLPIQKTWTNNKLLLPFPATAIHLLSLNNSTTIFDTFLVN